MWLATIAHHRSVDFARSSVARHRRATAKVQEQGLVPESRLRLALRRMADRLEAEGLITKPD